MVKVDLVQKNVVLTVMGLHKIWSFKNRIIIPAIHVISADRYDSKSQSWWKAIRVLGTNIPYVIKAGTFRRNGMNVFVDMIDPKKSIIIFLNNEFYKEIIIEVEDVENELLKLRTVSNTTSYKPIDLDSAETD